MPTHLHKDFPNMALNTVKANYELNYHINLSLSILDSIS